VLNRAIARRGLRIDLQVSAATDDFHFSKRILALFTELLKLARDLYREPARG
jgi:hypothetical protein